MGTGATRPRRRCRLAPCSRTRRCRAHQRPSGSSMAEPWASSRASAVRARAGVTGAPRGAPDGRGASAVSSATVTGPANCRWPPTQAAAASSSVESDVAPAWRSVATQHPSTSAARPSASRATNQRDHSATGRAITRESSRSCSSSALRSSGRTWSSTMATASGSSASSWSVGTGSPLGPSAPRPRCSERARVRRSSSGAPSRKVKGRPVRIPWANTDGSDDSTRWSSTWPDSTCDHRSTRPSTDRPSCRQSSTVWRART